VHGELLIKQARMFEADRCNVTARLENQFSMHMLQMAERFPLDADCPSRKLTAAESIYFLDQNPPGFVSRIVIKSVGGGHKNRTGIWNCHIPKIQPQPCRERELGINPLARAGLSRTALIVALQPADIWKLDDLAEFRQLNGPMLWRVHVE